MFFQIFNKSHTNIIFSDTRPRMQAKKNSEMLINARFLVITASRPPLILPQKWTFPPSCPVFRPKPLNSLPLLISLNHHQNCMSFLIIKINPGAHPESGIKLPCPYPSITKFYYFCARRNGRVVECGGLENRCTARYRGFESLFLRINTQNPFAQQTGFLFGSDRAKHA